MLPEHTARLLYGGGEWLLPGADDAPCEGAKFHSPTPLFTHDISLVPTVWQVEAGIHPGVVTQRAWLCGTCRDNLAILHQIIKATNGEVPWSVRREFGNELRRLAYLGWETYQSLTTRRDHA